MDILSKAKAALAILTNVSGEPIRIIGYGAAVVIWFVAGISNRIPDVTIDQSLVAATGAIAVVTEGLRRLVVSPATLDAVVTEDLPTDTAGPTDTL